MRSTLIVLSIILLQLAAIVLSQSCTTLRFTNETIPSSGSNECAIGTVAIGSRCVELTEVFAALPGKECSVDSDCGNPSTWVKCYAGRCDLVGRAEGDPCRADNQCSSGAKCIGNVCTFKKSGEGCNPISSPCGKGLFCGDNNGALVSILSTGTCQSAKGFGASCDSNFGNLARQCANGLYCSSGGCTPRKATGQGCDTAAVCDDSVLHTCSNGICVVAYSKGQGSQCFNDEECGEGLFCTGNQCQPKSPDTSCSCPSKDISRTSCHCTADGLSSCAANGGCAASRGRLDACFNRHLCSNGYDFDTLNCKQKFCRAEILNYYGCINAAYASLYPSDPKKRIGAMPGYNGSNQSFLGISVLVFMVLAHLL